MKYYKVKPEFDGKPMFIRKGNHVEKSYELVGNSLFTPAEFARIANAPKLFEEVNIPRTKTYYFFGVRFSTLEEA